MQVKDSKKAKFKLGVYDPKLGSAIQEATNIPCVANDMVGEVLRGAPRAHGAPPLALTIPQRSCFHEGFLFDATLQLSILSGLGAMRAFGPWPHVCMAELRRMPSMHACSLSPSQASVPALPASWTCSLKAISRGRSSAWRTRTLVPRCVRSAAPLRRSKPSPSLGKGEENRLSGFAGLGEEWNRAHGSADGRGESGCRASLRGETEGLWMRREGCESVRRKCMRKG